MQAEQNEYTPYGKEWKAEMMKIPKKHLVEMLKTALIKGVELREQEGVHCECCGEELDVDGLPREVHFFCSAECQTNFQP